MAIYFLRSYRNIIFCLRRFTAVRRVNYACTESFDTEKKYSDFGNGASERKVEVFALMGGIGEGFLFLLGVGEEGREVMFALWAVRAHGEVLPFSRRTEILCRPHGQDFYFFPRSE